MAKMIPASPYAEAPGSERRVFRRLEQDPDTTDWIVLHSLGLASRNRRRPYGEIDFVAIVPREGVACLEVKGGRISCKDGVWRSEDRNGNIHELKKSPFMQARDGRFSLHDALTNHFGRSAAESRCPTGYAVVLPDVDSPPPTPEFDFSEVIDRHALKDSVARRVRQCIRKAPGSKDERPGPSEVRNIKEFLRPDFEVVVTREAKIDGTVERLIRLTTEQFERLDELEDNDRCLFQGAAGTGKTMLAIEYARRRATDGSSVLLVCFNALLGEWIGKQFKDPKITAGNVYRVAQKFAADSTFHAEFDEKRGGIASGQLDRMDEVYSEYGALALTDREEQFDVLVVDEAQDILCSSHMRGFLDTALRGGLASGRWAMFGDFNRQALRNVNAEPIDADEALSDYRTNFARAKLRTNCRNARPIAEATAVVAGIHSPTLKRNDRTPELKVEHKYCRPSVLVNCLTTTVERLTAGGTRVEDIVVLSPYRLDNQKKCGLAGTETVAGHPLVDARSGNDIGPSCIRFSTIHAFKGLESKVVVLVDINEMAREWDTSLLYVGMSRARALLILLITDSAEARKVWEPRFREMAEQRTLADAGGHASQTT